MGLIADGFDAAFRDFATAGVPASGPNEPQKAEIRRIGRLIEQAVGGAVAGLKFYATKAALTADTAQPAGTLAYVYDDPTIANNTVYHYEAGGWVIDDAYFEGVATVVQPLVDDAKAAADRAALIADGLGANQADYAPPRTGPAAGAASMVVNRANGVVMGWTDADGYHDFAQDYRTWQDGGWDNLWNPARSRTMAVALTAGRSNGADALEYGQLNRTPAPMGVYPAGYTGPLDTYNVTRVTDPLVYSQFGNDSGQDALVNIGSPDGQTQYGIWETYQQTESKLRGYALRRRVQQPDMRIALSQAFAEGGKSLSFLDRPTTAQIMAGQMVSESDGTVAIPQTSAEYRMLMAGQPLSELWRYTHFECATRFFKGCRALAAMRRTAWLQYGLRVQVEMLAISHGEPDTETTEYGVAFRRYVLNLRDAIREITGAQAPPLTIYTAVMLSNDTGNEQTRTNETAARVVRMGEVTQDLAWVQPGFARGFFNPHIHSDPWTMRNEGEYYADMVKSVVIDGLPRAKGLRILSARIRDGKVVLRTQSPVGQPLVFTQPKSTTSHMPRTGMPYGFQYETPSGATWTARPMALADVAIAGSEIIITPPVTPAAGHRLSYNFDARAGSVTTDPGFSGSSASTWYDGTPVQLDDKLLPYRAVIGA